MTAVTRPLYIEQGATFTMGFNWCRGSVPATTPPTAGTPYNLTGCSARMQIRKGQQSTALIDISSTGTSPEISLGTTNGRIDVIIPPSVTNLLNVKTAHYDLEVVMQAPLPNGEEDVHRLLQGPVTISPNITQSLSDPVVGS